MADADLGTELLKADGVNVLTPEQQVRAVLARDRQWIRRLTGLAAAFWLLTLLTAGWMIWGYFEAMQPRLQVLMRELPNAGGRPTDPKELEGKSAEEKAVGLAVFQIHVLAMGMVLLTAVVGVAGLASVSSLLLVHLTRRATLRQINLSLQAISEQLRQMQAARPPAGPGG